jgi:hypothetical protein
MIVLKQRPNEKQLCSIEQKIKLIAVYNNNNNMRVAVFFYCWFARP